MWKEQLLRPITSTGSNVPTKPKREDCKKWLECVVKKIHPHEYGFINLYSFKGSNIDTVSEDFACIIMGVKEELVEHFQHVLRNKKSTHPKNKLLLFNYTSPEINVWSMIRNDDWLEVHFTQGLVEFKITLNLDIDFSGWNQATDWKYHQSRQILSTLIEAFTEC